MINLTNLNKDIIKACKDVTGCTQVINDDFLESLSEKDLLNPRIIIKLNKINDSKYYYTKKEYISINDNVQLNQDRVSTMMYDIIVSTDSKNSFTAQEYIDKIRDYFNFPGRKYFENFTVVMREVSNVNSFKQTRFQNADVVHRIMLTFDIDNKSFITMDYATRIKGTLETDVGNDNIDTGVII